MARRSSQYPTELELEILKILWREGARPVRDIRVALAAGFRELAYTSVMTMMNIMVNKGYLERKREGKSFVYRPRISEEKTSREMMGDLVERVFDGSAKAAMVNLLEMGSIDKQEIQDLRRMIDRYAKSDGVKGEKGASS